MKRLDTEALRLRGKAWLIAHGHSEKRSSAAAVDAVWFHSLADEARLLWQETDWCQSSVDVSR